MSEKNTHAHDRKDTEKAISSFYNTDKNEILGSFSGQMSLKWYGVK